MEISVGTTVEILEPTPNQHPQSHRLAFSLPDCEPHEVTIRLVPYPHPSNGPGVWVVKASCTHGSPIVLFTGSTLGPGATGTVIKCL